MIVRLNPKRAHRFMCKDGPYIIELNKDNPTADITPDNTSYEMLLTIKRALADGKLERTG